MFPSEYVFQHYVWDDHKKNQLRILKNGEIIFSCVQTDLDFGGDGELDKNVSDAIQKVLAWIFISTLIYFYINYIFSQIFFFNF